LNLTTDTPFISFPLYFLTYWIEHLLEFWRLLIGVIKDDSPRSESRKVSTMSDAAIAAANTLRAKQKPLKDRYRTEPSSALVTLSSSGSLDPTSTSLTCSLSTGAAARKVAGLHQAAGGEGFDASGELCSGDMLLESLVACFGVTVRAVATSLGIPLQSGTIIAEGDLDFRGTMGVKDPEGNAVPVGFRKIRLIVRLEVDDEHKSKAEKLIELSERYCVVLQTLKGVEVETKLGHVGHVRPDARSENGEALTEESANGRDVPANEDILKLN
jgi:uncharacterized OsmC-like protein